MFADVVSDREQAARLVVEEVVFKRGKFFGQSGEAFDFGDSLARAPARGNQPWADFFQPGELFGLWSVGLWSVGLWSVGQLQLDCRHPAGFRAGDITQRWNGGVL